MKNLTKGEVIALILAIAKKVAGQQATGISNITWNGQTNSLVFTMSDGSQITTPITLDASDIVYSNATSGLSATVVQEAIDEITSKINSGSLNLQYSSFGQNENLENTDLWKNNEDTSAMAIEHTNSSNIIHRVEANSTNSELQTIYNNGTSQVSVSTSSTGVIMSVIDTAGTNTVRLTPAGFTKNNVEIATTNDVYLSTGDSIVLTCNGTIESNEAIFVVEDDAEYSEELLVNAKEFEVDMNLAISGDIPLDIPMYITFKGYKTPIYNILVNNTTATVRDMLQLSKYENETGYRWIAKMRYILVSEPDAVRAFGIISTVTQQDIIRISNEDFLDYLTNGGLPQGQVALCDEIVSGSYNGYLLGHLYKFNIVYGETNQYSWTDITPAGLPTTTATINGNTDTYTIANAGTYIFLGDVGTLTITATDDVTVSVLGILGSVTLPETTQTILIHTVGYNGTLDTRPNSLKNGSVLGPYNIGRIDLA